MSAETLFAQAATGTTLTADPTSYTFGIEITVSVNGSLTGVWWNSPAGAIVLPQTIAIFDSTGTLIHSEAASWSGAAGSGWVRSPFTVPPTLSPGTKYEVCVLQNTAVNWYGSTANYWSSGAGSAGITSGGGHLSASNNAGATHGQDAFNASAVLTYPTSTFNAINYWVDPEFTPGTSQSGTAALTITPVFTAVPAVAHVVTAALTITPVFTVNATGPGSGTGSAVLAAMASIRRRRRR